MNNPRVYLCGPFSRCSDEETLLWRKEATARLNALGIVAVNPFRGEDLSEQRSGVKTQGVMERDHADVIYADALLVNFLGSQAVSIGSCFELAWAWDRRIPIAIAMEAGNIHDHIFTHRAAVWQTKSLEDAIKALEVYFSPCLT